MNLRRPRLSFDMQGMSATCRSYERPVWRGDEVADEERRSISRRDIFRSGIDDEAILVRSRDYEDLERAIRSLLSRVHRLKGKRLVTGEGSLVTAFYADRREERRLLRGGAVRVASWRGGSRPTAQACRARPRIDPFRQHPDGQWFRTSRQRCASTNACASSTGS